MGDNEKRIREDRRQLDEAMALAELALGLTTARKTLTDASLELCNASLRRLNITPAAEGEYREACAEVLTSARAVEAAAATLRRLGDRMRVAADEDSVAKALALAIQSREGIEIHIRRSLEKEMAIADLEAALTTARKSLADACDALSDASVRRSKADRGQEADYRTVCAEVLTAARTVDATAVALRRLSGRQRLAADEASVAEALTLAARSRGQVEILVRFRIWWSLVSA
jgi:hypothetical protein